MAKILSPGQKRRRRVQIITALVFAVITLAAGVIYGRLTAFVYDWADNYKTIAGTITELSHEVDEYRNLKGRLRESHSYWVSYEYLLDGDYYFGEAELSAAQYNRMHEQDPIALGYNPDDFYASDTVDNLDSLSASNTLFGNAVSVSPYTAMVALFLYRVLTLLFVRESKKVLPEGFYTQRSWLDVDDKVLVMADKNDVVYFDIHKHRVGDIQEAYQKGASLEELISLNKSAEVKRIPMADIHQMRSDHNSDTINIEHNGESHSVEFLNIALKNHALARFKLMMPESLSYQLKARTRLQGATPPLIWLLVLVGLFLFFDMFIVKAILAAIIVLMSVPSVVKQLINPTQTEIWQAPESETSNDETAQSA